MRYSSLLSFFLACIALSIFSCSSPANNPLPQTAQATDTKTIQKNRSPAEIKPAEREIVNIEYSKWQASSGEKSFFPNITRDEFIVIRNDKDLIAWREKLGEKDLFPKIDFSRHMIIGAIGKPMKQNRKFWIFRMYETPESIKVHLVNYTSIKPCEETYTPHCLFRVKRIDKPVIFNCNGFFAHEETPPEAKDGLIKESLTLDFKYALYVPKNLVKPAPLVVYMHGSSGNGEAILVKGKYNELADEFGFILLFPDCRNGYYWDREQDYSAIRNAICAVKSRYPVDEKRVFIGGYSAGGHTIYHFALTHRDEFRGFFSLAGRLNPLYIYDGLLKNAAKGLDMYIVCGIDDTIVPVKYVVWGKDLLLSYGANVKFRAIPKGQHGAPQADEERRKLFEWIRDLTDDAGKDESWPEDDAQDIVNHMNTYDSGKLMELEDTGMADKETEQWVEEHEKLLSLLDEEIEWNPDKRLYILKE